MTSSSGTGFLNSLTIAASGKTVRAAAMAGVAAGAIFAFTPSAALAQEEARPQADDQVLVIGSRVRGRTAADTPVPVDVISSQALSSTGQTEVGRMLQRLVPSFNFSSSTVSDGTDALRPATLRGLGPDQTLVLVNGKRRHQTALIHINTSVGRGSSGVDMNALPSGAIGRVEVLRDGASALYGSDAIAGVINIELRNQVDEGRVNVQAGQTYSGDGEQFFANANYGFSIAGDGYLNLTGEYRFRGRTNRAGLDGTRQFFFLNEADPACDFGAGPDCMLDPREATFDRRSHRIGDSQSEQFAFVANGAIPISPTGEFYFFGTFSDRQNESAGFYRRVVDRQNVVTDLFPDGFLPQIRTNITDWSLDAGFRWDLDNGWFIDLSANSGKNIFDFTTFNSQNASLGVNSPTTADTGALVLQHWNANLDLSRPFQVGGMLVNVAFGAAYRNERFQIRPSEPAAVIDGGALNTNCPGCDPATGGTPVPFASRFQVFSGFSPENAVNEDRDSYAAYLDLEADVTDRLLVSVAGRFEDFSDFGSTANGKIAARYQIADAFALRGAASTGFRAPSMHQRFFNSTSTQFVDIGGVQTPIQRGTFRNDSALAQSLGIPELKEETSVSLSGGAVFTPMRNLTISADYYRITIDDRIAISGGIGGAGFPQDVQDALAAAGAGQAQFFTNAADTRTRGVDIIATYNTSFANGNLSLSAAANFTDTEIRDGSIVTPPILTGFDAVLFTPQDRSIVEEWQPKSRINLTANYTQGQWGLVISGQRFGEYTVCEGTCDNPNPGPGQNVQTFSSKWLTDVQIDYRVRDSGITLTLGANNLFDVTPDRNLIGQARGGSIPGIVDSDGIFQFSRRSAPFGFNGGFYYGRVSYDF